MFTVFTPKQPTSDIMLAMPLRDSRGSLSDPRELAIVETPSGNVVLAGRGALRLKGEIAVEAMPPESTTRQAVTGTVLRNEIANYGPPWAAYGWGVSAASALVACAATFCQSPKLAVVALVASAVTALVTGGITLGDRTSVDHKRFRADARARLEANGIDVSAAHHEPAPTQQLSEIEARVYASTAAGYF